RRSHPPGVTPCTLRAAPATATGRTDAEHVTCTPADRAFGSQRLRCSVFRDAQIPARLPVTATPCAARRRAAPLRQQADIRIAQELDVASDPVAARMEACAARSAPDLV